MFSKLNKCAILLFIMLFFLKGCNPPSDGGETNRSVKFTTELVTDELEYPWQMSFSEDGRIFVTEVKGYVREVVEGSLKKEPWFDLTVYMDEEGLNFPESEARQRSGLHGLALDPRFKQNGYAYIGFAYHTDEVDYDYNRLIRLKYNQNTGKAEFDRVLLDKVGGFDLHQAAQIKFGPDGKLYWSVGDRFEEETAQNLEDLSGSILRMNSDGTIPSDNPFPNSYIYSFGHRNPQGYSWHPETGMMVATEHGPSSYQGCCRDEINIIEPGANYGWPVIRGNEIASGMKSPLIHSGSPSDGSVSSTPYTWAPSGATFIESGPWKNTFLFAGLRSQTLFQLSLDNSKVEVLDTLITNKTHDYHRVRSINQAPGGSIYMITSNQDRTYNEELGRRDYLIRIDVFYSEEEN